MLLVVAVVAVVAGLATYLTWLAGRLDRLHARVDGARSSLDAQLVRRAAVAAALVEHPAGARVVPAPAARTVARAAREAARAGPDTREPAENDLSRALHAAFAAPIAEPGEVEPLVADLAVAVDRVVMARRFYNDAVRDTRAVRERRLVRALRLAGRAPVPAYFEIDDSAPAGLAAREGPR